MVSVKAHEFELTEEILTKFWKGVSEEDKVYPKDCWRWNGYKGWRGTGKIFLDERSPTGLSKKSIAAHRVAWAIHNKKPIPANKMVLHSCGNKWCVNPEHIFLGSHRESMKLMKEKGEHHIGSNHGRSKLTEKDVLAIRVLHAEGKKSHRELAAMYGVNTANISFICRGETWKHVGGPRTVVKQKVETVSTGETSKKKTPNRWRKFSPKQVREIRRRYAAGETSSKLAEEFDTSVTTICFIASRKTHKSVK